MLRLDHARHTENLLAELGPAEPATSASRSDDPAPRSKIRPLWLDNDVSEVMSTVTVEVKEESGTEATPALLIDGVPTFDG